MLELFELGTYFQAVFMTALFLTSTINMCCIPNLFLREYKLITKLLTFSFNIVSFALCVFLTTGLHATLDNKKVPYISALLASNSEYILVFMLCNLAFLVYIAVGEYRYRKNTVSTSSIKESFDHLPTGLCFSKANGTVQLVNHKMNELSYLITGEELQNANLFWRVLCSGEIMPDVQRISEDKQPEFRLKDGTVYSFAREKVEKVFQITATDITRLHKLTNRLQDDNEELEGMNVRLQLYGETVDETTRARERLETKIRIHSELGQALLATRHSLSQSDAELQSVINAWKRNVAVLRTEAEPAQNADLLKSLIDIAESAGITVNIKGDFPENESIRSLLTSAATEALTNAVRHAEATTIFVELSETEDYYLARYANDGEAPSGEIREGGGLGSLRSKIERLGGEMEIQSLPRFVLSVKVPKEVSMF